MAKSTTSAPRKARPATPAAATPARTARGPKPEKPYEGFPLFAHPSGQWAKKIRGKLHYFGRWADPTEALAKLNREFDALKEGRIPRAEPQSYGTSGTRDWKTLADVCNAFLRAKSDRLDSGELSERSFRDYHRTCKALVAAFGADRRADDLRPEDFAAYRRALAKRFSPVSLGNEVVRTKVIFNFAKRNLLIPRPVEFGSEFCGPNARTVRKARREAGPRIFTREEAVRILDAADPQMRAMVLLALNCGFGNTDVANLPRSAVNLETGWVDYPRPKTEIHRRIPLWPETVAALKTALTVRPAPRDAADDRLVFLTRDGRQWVRMQERVRDAEDDGEHDGRKPLIPCDSLSPKFRKLLDKLGINGHRNFYTWRHCFETVAGECRDQVAVDAIMGHVDPSMAATYREGVSDERLRAAAWTVRAWLVGAPQEGGAA